MNEIEIEMKLFGAFRKYQQGHSTVTMRIEAPASVMRIKSALSKRLAELSADFDENGEQLIVDSALANDHEVLVADAMVDQSCKLSILPPVCGG